MDLSVPACSSSVHCHFPLVCVCFSKKKPKKKTHTRIHHIFGFFCKRKSILRFPHISPSCWRLSGHPKQALCIMHPDIQVHMLCPIISQFFTENIKEKNKLQDTDEWMKDRVFEINFPICLCNHILFCELLSTYTWVGLAFSCLPLPPIVFALSLAQSVFSLQWSTQGNQSMVLAGSSTSGVNTWWLQPQFLLANLPGRAQAVKACHLSPPDGNVTARGLLHLVGGEQTELSLLQVISVWKFPVSRFHLLEDGCAWKGVFAYFFPHHSFYFLLFGLLIFFLHYPFVFIARMFFYILKQAFLLPFTLQSSIAKYNNNTYHVH